MTGARRCILITGTFAVVFLAALVPAAAAAASLSRAGRAPGAPDPNVPGPSTVAPSRADPSESLSDPAATDPNPPPTTQPSATHPAQPQPPTDPPSAADFAPSVATGDPVPAPAPPATDPPVRAGRGAPARPAVAPRLAPVITTPAPSDGWADLRGGRQGPDPGSQPHPVNAQPQAQDVSGAADGPWSFLNGPEAGAHLFVAGFVALLFSIGGLVTVGIRRHRW